LRQNVIALPFTFTHVAYDGKVASPLAVPWTVCAVAVCAGAARRAPDFPNTAAPASPTILVVVAPIFDVLPFVCNYHTEGSSLSATFVSTTDQPLNRHNAFVPQADQRVTQWRAKSVL
jgi:hypothetical protein